jgi:hypothetical protein
MFREIRRPILLPFYLAFVLLVQTARAQQPTVPDFEVKLPLNPAHVLAKGHTPKDSVIKALGLKGSVTELRMLFLDGKGKELHRAGWDVRIRKVEDEDEDDIELTYKRRYPFGDDSLSTILAKAADDGFDASEADYKGQVEWGLKKRTLSLSRKKNVQVAGLKGMKLPERDAAREIAVDKIPGKLSHFQRDGWAKQILEGSKLYGPVRGRRWSGKHDGVKLDFEVWEIRTEDGEGFEPIVELSFKADDESEASSTKKDLIEELLPKGWLMDHEILKTDLILERF